MEKPQSSRINRFVVPMTIMLTFISFWRAAAIVLADLGSSAYYVGGITEKAIGKSAPQVRNYVSPHQSRYRLPASHHRHQPRQCLHARRSLRVWGGLELCDESPGRLGAPIQGARSRALESAAQHTPKEDGDSCRLGSDYIGVVFAGRHQLIDEDNSNHLRSSFHSHLLYCFFSFRETLRTERTAQTKTRRSRD